MGTIQTIGKWWKRVRAEQVLVFGGMVAGLFLLYVSSLNIYLGTPVTENEIRLTQGFVGLSFIFITVALWTNRKHRHG
jgi:hypothetical protein